MPPREGGGSENPVPSSRTVRVAPPASLAQRRTQSVPAFACLTAFVTASWAIQ
jgi:hypothetical protein